MEKEKVAGEVNQEGPDDRRGARTSARVVDPSEAVTGLGFAFGVIGALVGIVAAVFVSPAFTPALFGYCLLSAIAGGSAGIVTGGMVGAVLAVLRGVTTRGT